MKPGEAAYSPALEKKKRRQKKKKNW